MDMLILFLVCTVHYVQSEVLTLTEKPPDGIVISENETESAEVNGSFVDENGRRRWGYDYEHYDPYDLYGPYGPYDPYDPHHHHGHHDPHHHHDHHDPHHHHDHHDHHHHHDHHDYKYRWERTYSPMRPLPPDAVRGGVDSTAGCEILYVGRTNYQGQYIPCKICATNGWVYIDQQGQEVKLDQAEVLVSPDVMWRPVRDGRIPWNAFQVGRSSQGERLYIGRAFVGTLMTPGKVNGNTKRLYMTYGHKVFSTLDYEILVLRDRYCGYDDYWGWE